jgi:hypothetical protein
MYRKTLNGLFARENFAKAALRVSDPICGLSGSPADTLGCEAPKATGKQSEVAGS